MPTFRQLQYLVAVDETRHFGRAADLVHVSQPTLSAQLAQLEHRLKIKLFERGRHGVYPTPSGQEIIARARLIVRNVDQLVDFAHNVAQPLSGRITFGTPPTLGPYILPHIVPELHKRFPELKFIIREGAPKDIQKAVEDGAIDIALTPTPVLYNRLHTEHIFTEYLNLGVSWDHELGQKEIICGEDLKGQEILTMARGHHLHDQVKDLCDKYEAELLYEYEGGSLDALRHMVVMGAGATFFPELYIQSEIEGRNDLTIKILQEEKPSRQIAMVWRKDISLHDDFIAMSNLFKKQAAKIGLVTPD